MAYSSVEKHPGAVLDYTYEWAGELDGDTISSSTFPNFPPGITLNSTTPGTNFVRIWLSGGTTDQDYAITNRIVTTGGRTMYWTLVVRVSDRSILPIGPPFATIAQAIEFQPKAEGEPALKIETVLEQAASWVAKLAPYPEPKKTILSLAMDATQSYVPIEKMEALPKEGTVRIENELIRYGWITPDVVGTTKGPGRLSSAMRGRNATVPSAHTQGVAIEEADYPLKALGAELAVFEWLWDTRGYKPSRQGVIGSESYSIDPAQIEEIVRGTMGRFYTGGAKLGSVAVKSTFPQSQTARSWIGNI